MFDEGKKFGHDERFDFSMMQFQNECVQILNRLELQIMFPEYIVILSNDNFNYMHEACIDGILNFKFFNPMTKAMAFISDENKTISDYEVLPPVYAKVAEFTTNIYYNSLHQKYVW